MQRADRDYHRPSMQQSSRKAGSSSSRQHRTSTSSSSNVLMVGPNFRVGRKIGCGNFGELRLGMSIAKTFSLQFCLLYCELVKRLKVVRIWAKSLLRFLL